MKIKFDTYTIIARFFPAIISALPFFVLLFFISEIQSLRDLISYLSNLRFYGTVTFSIVFLYFYAELIRITSKCFERKYFLKEKGFPTTYLMLFENREYYSNDYKEKYRAKIKRLFDLDLLNSSEESQNLDEAIKKLNETIKHVILKVGDGKLVKKHNIWYGFYRNLIGGSIYAVILSLFNIFISLFVIDHKDMTVISTILIILYLLVFIFRKQILFQAGEEYAKQLIAEFMTL